MPKVGSFEQHTLVYDAWFDKHPNTYEAELAAVGDLIGDVGRAVEVGVGTGRFASRLGIALGVEPSQNMARLAVRRGVEVVPGSAEDLPLPDAQFDLALMVTVFCFLADLDKALREARRVLKNSGSIVVAFIDADSSLGRLYEENKASDEFYANATFYSAPEITARLAQAGFTDFEYRQTVFGPEDLAHPVVDGYGTGGFVVIRARVEVE